MSATRVLRTFVYISFLTTMAGCRTGESETLPPPVVEEQLVKSPLDRQLLEYLTADCGTGESDPAASLKAVVQFGGRAVKPLLTSVREGPPESLRLELQRDARGDFKSLRDFVRSGGLSAMRDVEVVVSAQELDERTYVAMRVDGFVQAYRERALNALVELSDPASVDELRAIAELPTLPEEIRDAVNEAIRKIR